MRPREGHADEFGGLVKEYRQLNPDKQPVNLVGEFGLGGL